MNFFLKRWLSDSTPAQVPSRRRKLSIEQLEDRTTPSITIADVPDALPAVQSSNVSTVATGYDPQTAINPQNPDQIVTVYSAGGSLGIALSGDRGQTWVPQTSVTTPVDPLTGAAFAVVDSPALAFDNANNLYVAFIAHDAANTSGVVIAEKFQIQVTFTTQVVNQNQRNVLYRWASQDPVFNLAVGVNGDLGAYTDPTGGVQTNDNPGRGIYVAWNTKATQSGLGGLYTITPGVVFAVVSDNGGQSYSTPQSVSDNGFRGAQALDPKIFFTSSVSGGTNGGKLGFAFDNGASIVTDVKDPFQGRNTSNPLTVQQSVSDNGGLVLGANAAVLDANGAVVTPASSRQTTFTKTVNISNSIGFDSLVDMDVVLAFSGGDLGSIQVDLIAPDNTTVRLLNNRFNISSTGSAVAASLYLDGTTPGLPSGTTTIGGTVGLTFDQQAARYVNDSANLAPYIIRVKPEDFGFGAQGLDKFNGLTPTNGSLNGNWRLRVTNYSLNAAAVSKWDMKFVARVDTAGFGNDSGTGRLTAATTAGAVGTLTTASPSVGVQGWYSVAVDNTKGSFSPYQGRIYVAYTSGSGNDTDVRVAWSDDNGGSWSNGVKVNDDSASDGFSEGTRAQFQPTVTVDPTTGTVVVMWYDARWDASNARPATFVATSVDGGATFSPNAILSPIKTAIDANDGSTVKIEPVPNNLAALGAAGFGNGQGLVAYGGTVVPVWTGNANAAGASLLTAVTRIAAGPRVLQGDMGPVTDDFTVGGGHNNLFDVDGTRQLTAVYVRFDRRVDPTTFTAADVRLMYRDTTGAAAQDISSAVLSVTAVDANALGATRFLISLTPQSRVGTYSYAVGPDVSDRIREVSGAGVLLAAGNRMDQNGNAVENQAADAFANPTPTGGVPFVLPYATDSLPLVITGPRLVSSTPVTTLDGTVSSIDVTFDRDMLASSFTAADVLELRTPYGAAVTSGFTVAANPPGTPAALANRTFRVGIPTQAASGYYALVLGADIQSASGASMDANANAGLDIVNGKTSNAALAGTVSNAYNTGNVPVAIAAAASVNSPSVTTYNLSVSDSFVITQLPATPIQLRLDITFPDVRTLSAQLIAPDGTVIQLFTNVGQFGVATFANFTGTTLNDFAPASNLIQNGSAPFTNGPFLPQQPLTALNGKVAAGTWRLVVTNSSTTQTGSVNFWGLSLPRPVLGSGLGEPVADRTTVGFRIFTANPSLSQSTTTWTPLGPTKTALNGASGNGGLSGVVTATATDPSDPSGNTVYLGSGYGGLWKTTNFLTAEPSGPTWIPLTDFGPSSALHISSITIVPQNNDPAQSLIYVGTGDADVGLAGLGFLRSTDGGKTFRVLNSTSNADALGAILPISSASRDNVFSTNSTYVSKIVADPVRLANGEVVLYAAVGGSATTQGLWRSVDSGRTWTRIQSGECTDIVLAPNRFDLDANGKPYLRSADIAYAAFSGTGGGVYFSNQISAVGVNGMTRLDGGGGKPLFTNGASTITVGAPASTPSTSPNRILLAVPAASNSGDPLSASVYQGWLYALVVGGTAPGLYMTKDFGANWTLVRTQSLNDPNTLDDLTNDETKTLFQFGAGARFNALAADPTDPNVVYVGGNESSSDSIYRIDVSALSDAHAQVKYDNSKGGVGTQQQSSSVGGITLNGLGNPPNQDYFNRLRNPLAPFVTGATQTLGGVTSFTNTGQNAMVSRLSGTSVDNVIRGFEVLVDPLTGKTRLNVATEAAVYTTVDAANPNPTGGLYANAKRQGSIGSAQVVAGDRSSNLQIALLDQTAVQPSALAADLAGIFNKVLRDPFTNAVLPASQQVSVAGEAIYAVSPQGYLNPDKNLLEAGAAGYGNDKWKAIVPTVVAGATTGYVQTDPGGSGTIYQYRPPVFATTAGGADVGNGFSTDVFLVTPPGQQPIGRTNGLFNQLAGDSATAGQWAGTATAYFAVNPVDASGIVISAPNGGQVYLTTNQGANWFSIGSAATFGNSPGTALAFGGRDPNQQSANTFIYNGTAAGKIWVTTSGGGVGGWKDISTGLSGGSILKIIPNPKPGTRDAYAITATGVFYVADATVTTPTWVSINGSGATGLFTLSKSLFGEANTNPILTALTALEVDWRFTTPVLYAAGDSGVFRSVDGGANWSLYPAGGAGVVAGGYLPDVKITDLDLVYGALNSSGVPDQSTGTNLLVASTYGRGVYAIRLDPASIPSGLGTSGPFVSAATVTQPPANGSTASITVTFGDASHKVQIDPTTLTSATLAVVAPGNVGVPFTVTDVSLPVSGGTASAANKYRFDFSPPTSGNYTIQMNTGVRDITGRQLNQNQNSTNGEAPADYYVSPVFTITVNQPPTITSITNQSTPVGTATGPLAFTVGDAETTAATLTVSKATSDTTVLPLANITLTQGVGGAWTVNANPAAAGNATVTLTVTDAGGRQTSTSFLLVATPVVATVVPFTDNFNRADAATLGNQWINQIGSAAVSSSTVVANSVLSLATVSGLSLANSVTQATLSVSNSAAPGTSASFLVARYGGPGENNEYLGGVIWQGSNVTAAIFKFVNGVGTLLSSSAPFAFASGYLVRFEVVNDSLKLFVNGSLAAFAYDGSLTAAGQVGLRLSSGNRADDFSADALALLTPTLAATDAFTGADGSQLGRSWRDRAGNLSVSGNQLAAPAVGSAPSFGLSTYNATPSSANEVGQVAVSFTAAGQYAGVALRYAGTGDSDMYWGALISQGGGQQLAVIFRNVGGVWTQLASATLAGTGGTLRFEAVGDSLKLFVGGSLAAYAYDGSLTAAGQVGVRVGAGAKVDDFSADVIALPTPTLAATDAFTGADGSQLGRSWRDRAGNLSVSGNQLAAPAVGSAPSFGLSTYNATPSSANEVGQVAVSFTAAGQYAGVALRYAGTGDSDMYWGALISQGGGQQLAVIFRNVGGVWTQLASATLAGTGGTLRFEAVGDSLKLFVGGSLAAYAYDGSLTAAGQVGVRVGAGAKVDDFSADVIALPTPTLAATDAFTGADGSQLGRSWRDRAGNLSVSGNQLAAPAVGSAPSFGLSTYNATPSSANEVGQVAVSFTAAGQYAGVALRYAGTGDSDMYWGALISQGGGQQLAVIFRNVGGVWTQLASATLAGTGGTLRFEAVGDSLKLFVGGSLAAYAYDGSLTAAGQVGVRVGAGAKVDDFSADVIALPTPTLAATDAFTGADGSQLGRSWRDRAGNLSVSGNQLAAPAVGSAPSFGLSTYNATPSSANEVGQVAVSFTAAGQYAGVALRYAGTGDSDMYWGALISQGGGQQLAVIFRNVGGVWTQLASATLAGTGGTLRFEAVGDSLKLFVGGSLAAYAYDGSLTAAGQVGVRVGAGAKVDDFSADVIALPTPTLAATDAFTGADGSQLGRSWRDRAGNLSIFGGQLVGQSAVAGVSTYNATPSSANESGQVDVGFTADGQYAGVALRYAGTGDSDMYWGGLVRLNSGQQLAVIFKNVGGTWTLLSSATLAGTGGTLRFDVTGSSLSLFVNSTQVTSASDGSLTAAGQVGVRVGQGGKVDNFTANTI